MNILSSFKRLTTNVPLVSTLWTFRKDFPQFLRMMKAYFTGGYRAIPWKTFAKMGFGALYLVFFIDFIPDFIPIIGFIDDAAVLLWVWSSIKKDLVNYDIWEKTKENSNSERAAIAQR